MPDAVSLKRRLADRQTLIGSWLSFGFTPVCEMMCRANFDFLVVDMEHTAIGVASAHELIQVISLAGVVPLVRVGANDPLLIKRSLDAGAHGVVVPMVNSVADAERAVSAAYYPPVGTRGAGLARAQGYGLDFAGYRERASRETVVVVQIEHVDGVRNLEAILDVDGVDAFIVGPYDLSGSLGSPGKWDDPEVIKTLEEVERVTRLGMRPGGFHVVHSDHDELKRRLDAGYTFIAYGDDMVFLAEKLRDEMGVVRAIAHGRTV